MKKNKRIYIKDWLEFKPYKKQAVTDVYYLKLCNDVKKAITTHKQAFVLQSFLHDEEINLLSCFLTSYFEDLISETNIWNTFVRIHKKLYGKPLPFYDLHEYYEEEINHQDIGFLIWYFLNTVQEEKFVLPFNFFISEITEKILDVFDKEWEFAPENEYLQTFYQIDQNESDYYFARNLIDIVLFKTYLFYPDTSLKLIDKEIEIIKNTENQDNLKLFLDDNRDSTIHNTHTRLLSLKGKECVSEILGANHPLSKDYLMMSKRIQGLFLYKGQDDDNIFIEHIASGKKFNLTKKSFDHSHTIKELDTILFMGIVRWKDEWWFSGVFFQQPYNADIILKEKNSFKSRMSVNFLDHENPEINEMLQKQLKAFRNYNNGSQIVFLPSEKIEAFVKGCMEFYNKTLNLSKKQINKAIQKVRDDGFFGTNDTFKDFSEVSDTGLVFFNPNSGVEVAMNVNSAFPVSLNPYFKEEESDEHVERLLLDDSLSTELVLFCIDNFKDKLPFFTRNIGKEYLEDIDFLLRFWKGDNYHSIPSITPMG